MKQQIIIIGVIYILILFSSCMQTKHIIYLQDVDDDKTTNIFEKQQLDYKIQPHDILYVKIISINKEIVALFNNVENLYQAWTNEASLYINGFSVNDTGYVNLPILGKIQVIDLTIEEAQEIIQSHTDKYLKDATAIVKLINFKVTILGEVRKPGVYKVYNDQITILEALGMAGDITDFGNKKNVLLIRSTKNNSQTIRIDLTDKNLLASNSYFMLPNDVIYIEPVKSKAFRLSAPSISIVLSSITTLILILRLFM